MSIVITLSFLFEFQKDELKNFVIKNNKVKQNKIY